MPYRSWLVVPGASEKKLGKAIATGADAVVIDLADSVPIAAKPAAREIAASWLDAHRHQVIERRMTRWVRINALDSRMWRDDLVAVMPGAPDGIVLPLTVSPEAVREIAAEIYELENHNAIPAGTTKVIALVAQSAESVLAVGDFPAATLTRLAGLGWDAHDLMRSLGATRTHDDRSAWTDAFRFARAQMLLAAHACGIMALETPHLDFNDIEGLKTAAKAARADGFTGMFAVHPAQVAEINAAFTPTDAEIEEAGRIIAAYGSAEVGQDQVIERRTIGDRQLALAKRTLGLDDPQDHATGGSRPNLRPA